MDIPLSNIISIVVRYRHLMESWEESGFGLTVKGDLKEQSSNIFMVTAIIAIIVTALALSIVVFMRVKR